jgi:hypothetical protein
MNTQKTTVMALKCTTNRGPTNWLRTPLDPSAGAEQEHVEDRQCAATPTSFALGSTARTLPGTWRKPNDANAEESLADRRPLRVATYVARKGLRGARYGRGTNGEIDVCQQRNLPVWA